MHINTLTETTPTHVLRIEHTHQGTGPFHTRGQGYHHPMAQAAYDWMSHYLSGEHTPPDEWNTPFGRAFDHNTLSPDTPRARWFFGVRNQSFDSLISHLHASPTPMTPIPSPSGWLTCQETLTHDTHGMLAQFFANPFYDGYFRIVRYRVPAHAWTAEHEGLNAQVAFLRDASTIDHIIYTHPAAGALA